MRESLRQLVLTMLLFRLPVEVIAEAAQCSINFICCVVNSIDHSQPSAR